MQIKNVPRYFLLMLGLLRDDQLGIRLISTIGRRCLPNYKFTWPELDWFEDPGLNRILDEFGEPQGLNAHRRLALRELLRLTDGVAGDTAECGSFKGCGSYIILASTVGARFQRHHHVFDSFEGLSDPNEGDGDHWKKHDLAVQENELANALSKFRNFTTYKGWIPERFPELTDKRFSFVHVDVDLYEPTYASIEFFYDRLNAGGILVCDDYGFNTCPGATAAADSFLASKPEKMLRLAGGGGFFIKGLSTAKG